ncbi:zinc protease [Arcticibacter tournemirensis]|uniref:Insulinase family protein n=1 Tax=Arcticibacter tournemirensis TaxID=699437 RepID=A0A5M9HGB3_9SPHI|nr:M16 family metallopeptidase [Arcticibacter tournemirensis]KAA8485529.1 insulinase family protein [Arcticibacter tournemirensis]TQM48760.1 zinc protease [Arcticibacter tournemirensis]
MKKCIKSWLYLLVLSICINGYVQAQPNLKTKTGRVINSEVLPLDTAIKVGKLKNGFTYYIRRNTEPKERVQLYLATKAGSILENEQQLGLAHFMEHMSFNGTKNFPKNELVNYLQKSGVRFGADLNAYTSFDETVYQLPLPTDDPELFKNGMQIMRDWAQDALLDPSEIDKERGVILEEKRLGKGAQERMQNKYLPMLFNNSRYAKRLPIGTEEVLKSFKPETIRQFYKDWYRPELQALIVVGDVNVAQVEKMIISMFSDLKNPAKPLPRTKYTIPLLNKNQFIAVTDKEMPYTVAQVMVKHPAADLKTTGDMRNSIVRTLYNLMISARFSELMKQANPPFLQGGSSIGDFMAGLDVASAFVVAKPGELESGFKAVYTEIERARNFGFVATELERAKQSYMTSMEAAYKEKDKTSSENYVQEYLRLFLQEEASPGIDYEYNFAKNTIGGISLEEVNGLTAKYLTDVNRDVIIMAPEKETATLPVEATVNAWIQAVKQSNITAYSDQVSDKPLLAVKPTAGKVVSEKKIGAIGVTELTLSNGVKVVLKPTDFKNDEILINAFSPGGTSLYSDADYQSASSASSLVARSGISEFNSIQLPKLLTGKRVSVTPYISERAEGISAFSAPKDLETALQLVYLYFTQPRKDEEIFKSVIQQQKGALANRENDPNSVFSDTISAVLGNYNIRRTGPTLSKIEQIDLEKAYSIYKDRFADASDFTFTFVGSFKDQEIRPLLEQYLGALPSSKRKEEAKDLGIYPPAGEITKNVYKGQEDKATVRLIFSGDYKYSDENNNRLDALAEVLQIKLIERLREEESGVYSPGAGASYSKNPRNRYSVTVAFGCAPANVDKLVNATLDEINKIKQNGAQAGDIEKYVAEERRTTETQLKQNGFWAGYLTSNYQLNEDPLKILTYLDSLKKITPESLKTAANEYLSGSNLIKFVLLPEKK